MQREGMRKGGGWRRNADTCQYKAYISRSSYCEAYFVTSEGSFFHVRFGGRIYACRCVVSVFGICIRSGKEKAARCSAFAMNEMNRLGVRHVLESACASTKIYGGTLNRAPICQNWPGVRVSFFGIVFYLHRRSICSSEG